MLLLLFLVQQEGINFFLIQEKISIIVPEIQFKY